jgi:hypothetical protein
MPDDALIPDARPRRRCPFGWLGLLALAWVIFELTHQPGLAAVFVCMKFGIDDFSTAGRLYRLDPVRPRARATFCLYFAWGLLKMACVALLMTIAFASLLLARGAPVGGGAAVEAAWGTAVVSLVGLHLSAALTALAIVLASRGNVRLWLGRGPKNRLGRLVMAHALIALFHVCAGLLSLRPSDRALLLIALLVLSSPLLLALCRDAVAARVGAERPEECWPIDEKA